MQDLKGRVAVITGGANGVGRALGVRLVAEGAQVVLADINQEKLDEVAAELGHGTVGIKVDVSKEESVEALAAQVFERFGACHLLWNNAGVGLGEAAKPIWTLPANDWKWGIDVNVLGVVYGIKAFVPRMIESGEEGVIINSSSSNGGLRSMPNTPIYAATKAAVTSITEVLYQQLIKHGGGKLRAAILFPGPNTVNTAIMASRKVRPAEYAGDKPEPPAAYETMQQLMEATGLKMKLTEPHEVADFAVDQLKAGTFWMLPESADNDKMTRNRFEGLLARANPPSAW